MSVILTLLAALIATGACAYHRSSLRTWAIVTMVTTLVVGLVAGAPWTTVILLIIEAAIALPLLMVDFRRRQISAPLLKLFAKVRPRWKRARSVSKVSCFPASPTGTNC